MKLGREYKLVIRKVAMIKKADGMVLRLSIRNKYFRNIFNC
jgi:hypothetical protein